MSSRLNSASVPQRDGHADRPMAAHSQIAHVVEEDQSGSTIQIRRFAQERADDHVRSAGFADHGLTESVVILAKPIAFLSDWPASKIGKAGNDETRRLAPRVGIDDLNALHVKVPTGAGGC